MKKLIYGGLFVALIGILFVGCEKDEVRSNNSDGSKVKTDILNVFYSIKNGNNNKSLVDFNYENSNNPLDSIGFLHNEVLKFIMSDDINDTEICNKLSDINTEFGVNISNDCDQLFEICEGGISGSLDSDGDFKSDLLLSLHKDYKIEDEEFEIISTTFLHSNDLDFYSKMEFIKDIEEYTMNNSALNTVQKNRILRTFAIYRYSSYYWEIENPQPNALGPVSAYADACAEYWALNDPDSPAQDGASVYAFAGAVSAVVHVLTGL